MAEIHFEGYDEALSPEHNEAVRCYREGRACILDMLAINQTNVTYGFGHTAWLEQSTGSVLMRRFGGQTTYEVEKNVWHEIAQRHAPHSGYVKRLP